MTRTRALIPLALAFVLVACASAPPDDRDAGMRRPMMSSRGGMSGDFDLLPRANWWHEAHLNEALNLSGEQMQKLDALQNEHSDEITRLQNDQRTVMRDLRSTLDRRDATADDIVTAGNRYAALRDDLVRKQIAYLAAQRAVLTIEQWKTLQQSLEVRDDERMGPRGGGPPGGMGGRGRGRGRGW